MVNGPRAGRARERDRDRGGQETVKELSPVKVPECAGATGGLVGERSWDLDVEPVGTPITPSCEPSRRAPECCAATWRLVIGRGGGRGAKTRTSAAIALLQTGWTPPAKAERPAADMTP